MDDFSNLRNALREVFRAAGWRDDGPNYGLQKREVWDANVFDERPLVDATRACSLWRVSIIGDLVLNVGYGTSSRVRFQAHGPLEATFPGFVEISGQPRVTDHSEPVVAEISLTPAFGHTVNHAALVTAVVGPAITLPPNTKRIRGLTAGSVTVQGTVVAFGIGDTVTVVGEAVLTAGTVILEFAI